MSNRPKQKCFFDITGEDVPPGDLSSQMPQMVPDCRSSEHQPAQDQAAVPIEKPPSERSRSERGVQSISSSGRSLLEQACHLSPTEREEESIRRAERLDSCHEDGQKRRIPSPLRRDSEPTRRCRWLGAKRFLHRCRAHLEIMVRLHQ